MSTGSTPGFITAVVSLYLPSYQQAPDFATSVKYRANATYYMSDSSILSLIGIKKQNYNLPERRETLEAISFMYRTGYFSFVNI